jgi:hypothetical protein
MQAILLSLILTNGTYRCLNGNEPSICDQMIKTSEDGIFVLYAGDCASRDPYFYHCQGKTCQDQMGVITFEIKDKTHYRWENKQYGFYCDFAKI